MSKAGDHHRLAAWFAHAGLLLFAAVAAAELWAYARLDPPPVSDFFGIWSWSRFVMEGREALYDPASLHRFQQELDPLYAEQYYPFLYPPAYLLFIWPLAYVEQGQARLLWSAATLVAYLAALGLPRWRPSLLAAALVSPATVLCLICGQNGLLTAALMIGGLRCAATRPILAGVMLGLLTYKPHLGALMPVALIAARLWPALVATIATGVASVVASSLAFGAGRWSEWLGAQTAGWATVDGFITAHASMIPTASAGLQQFGSSVAFANAGQLVSTMVAAAVLWIAWRRGRPILVAPVAALLASPYAGLYDLPMLSGAALLALAGVRDRWTLAGAAAALLLPQLMFVLPGASVPVAAPVLALLLLWQLRAANGVPMGLHAPEPSLRERRRVALS